MTTKKKRVPGGATRTCKTKTCRKLFTPGKAGDFGDYCRRCRHWLSKGEAVPPRSRQPNGQAKVNIKARLPPELARAITPLVLLRHDVKNAGDFLRLAGSLLLELPEFKPAPLTDAQKRLLRAQVEKMNRRQAREFHE